MEAVTGTYDMRLVALSFAIASVGAYTALRLAREIPRAHKQIRWIWLISASCAMGGGAIWSMHFIGMLAFDMGMPVSYDLRMTIASLLLAILVTGVGLWVVSKGARSLVRLGLSGLLMGAGVAGMHYSGMAAMEMNVELSYRTDLFVLSLVIAVVAATAALWLVFNLTKSVHMYLASLVMGVAVCGMHYVGMAAAIFTPTDVRAAASPVTLSPELMAYAIFTVTLIVLATGLVLGGSQPEIEIAD